MFKQVIWTSRAKLSLKKIADFIAVDNRKTALEFAIKLYSKSDILAEFPDSGREGKARGTRELVVHKNYIMVYRVKKNEVQILYVYHSTREFGS